jgi:glucosylceramidase
MKIKYFCSRFGRTDYLIILLLVFMGCTREKAAKLLSTSEILLTSSGGEKLTQQENIRFTPGKADSNVIYIYPDSLKQIITGIGSSFTESSAFVLAHLDKDKRQEVMENIFSSRGANFSLTRTHIGACDFTVKGKYSYAKQKDDWQLTGFRIGCDQKGFKSSEFPGIKDETYDLLPMIKEAFSIKEAQEDSELKIIASAWTAPDWMKDIEDWYIPGAPENNWQGTGGSLKEEYVPVYADYLVKYLKAYKEQGIDIWGITPVNEPHGNNGQWESMNFSPHRQNEFIKKYLGPKLRRGGFANIKLFIYDQNRDGLEDWTDVILADAESSQYVYGSAVHWYESTFKVFENVFERVHKKFPDFAIIHTEGCIDDLGKGAPGGVTDPEGYKEENWFANDEFWWNKTASDWAYSVTWEGVKVEDHPLYVPVHRYARNIIVSMDHWLEGWIDWNIVLDSRGGPNHVGNYCGAPIMIDTESGQVYYTPIFYVLSQFSRTIRPGDRAVQTHKKTPGFDNDALHACATLNDDNILSVQLLNTTSKPMIYNLQLGDSFAEIEIAANAIQTVRIQL